MLFAYAALSYKVTNVSSYLVQYALTFEVDLLKSQEINLDYILELIFEHNKKTKNKADLIDEIRRVIRASLGNRAKESLVVDFINETDLDTLQDKANVIDSFFVFAQNKHVYKSKQHKQCCFYKNRPSKAKKS